MNNSTQYIMSDDMALGFYDADGWVILGTDWRTSPNGTKSISYKVVYGVGQSLSKQDIVLKFAEKFNGTCIIDQDKAEFRANQTSQVGQIVRNFLKTNQPKHPARRRDWLISEEVIPLLSTSSSKVDKLTIACLIKEKSRFLKQGESDEYFTKCCEHLRATPTEIQQVKAAAKPLIEKIEKALTTFTNTLPTTRFSDDYVLGTHYGDGSFCVGLSWKPIPNKVQRLRCEPSWGISGDDQTYCQAFANQYSGRVADVDNKGQKKFVLNGQTKCASIFPLFDNAPWMPTYKKDQYDRWKESINLLIRQDHFTETGIRKLLDLTYGLAEKGSRPHKKEEYLAWGLEWLNNPNRQKRQPRGELES